MRILPPEQWQPLLSAHEHRANYLLDTFRHPDAYHPVNDFLFEYYPVRPSHLRRWHPGAGIVLAGDAPHAQWRDYHRTPQGVTLDIKQFWARRGESVLFIRNFLEQTAVNQASYDCFGLHEWAMVYRTDNPRHSLPLRLGAEGTNAVVDTHKIKCSHFDAYRFFTPAARPLNLTVLSRQEQPFNDQTGCVHVTMDLYKWAWKLGPLVPGDLFLDTLELAVEARTLDMEASPYDCRSLGFGIVAIETPEGKAEYVRRQRQLTAKAKPLRDRLVALIDSVSPAKLSK